MVIQVDKSKSNDYIEILCIEEGSVDTSHLLEIGVPNENLLVYRKGSKAPYLLRIKKGENQNGEKEN